MTFHTAGNGASGVGSFRFQTCSEVFHDSAITAAVAVVPLSVIYILSRSSFEGLFPSLLQFISPFAHFAAFCQFGTFSVQSLILLLSYPVLFVFLTVQSADKKRWD